MKALEEALGVPLFERSASVRVTAAGAALLARMRDASPLAVDDWLGSRAIGRLLGFTADRFVLFSSRSGHGGPPYVVEAEYALAKGWQEDAAWA